MEFKALLITFKYYLNKYHNHFILKDKVYQYIFFHKKINILLSVQDKMFFILVYLKINSFQRFSISSVLKRFHIRLINGLTFFLRFCDVY